MNVIFKPYQKKATAWLTPWVPGIDLPMHKVSISQEDRKNGSPKQGDMIAVNEKNPDDMWLIAEKFFEDNYEESPSPVTFTPTLDE